MHNIPFFDTTLFNAFYYFIFWSVFGWCLETVVRTIETGEFEPRGFLNGPICPIYGFGVISMILISKPIIDNIILLYFVSVIICSLLELTVGILLEKLFDGKWWDYSTYKFNYKGIISLKISLLWGLGCVIVLKFIHPFLNNTVEHIPHSFGNIMAIFAFSIIIIDLICSILEVIELKNKLRQLDNLAKVLRKTSDTIGGNISKKVLTIKDNIEPSNIKENLSYEISNIKEKYEYLTEQIINSKHIRIIRSFPYISSNKYNYVLSSIKYKLKSRKNRKSPFYLEEIKSSEKTNNIGEVHES